jgi:hypothetical protein
MVRSYLTAAFGRKQSLDTWRLSVRFTPKADIELVLALDVAFDPKQTLPPIWRQVNELGQAE